MYMNACGVSGVLLKVLLPPVLGLVAVRFFYLADLWDV